MYPRNDCEYFVVKRLPCRCGEYQLLYFKRCLVEEARPSVDFVAWATPVSGTGRRTRWWSTSGRGPACRVRDGRPLCPGPRSSGARIRSFAAWTACAPVTWWPTLMLEHCLLLLTRCPVIAFDDGAAVWILHCCSQYGGRRVGVVAFRVVPALRAGRRTTRRPTPERVQSHGPASAIYRLAVRAPLALTPISFGSLPSSFLTYMPYGQFTRA